MSDSKISKDSELHEHRREWMRAYCYQINKIG